MEIGLFACPICYEDFDLLNKIPRIMPKCGHSLCLVCLKKLFDGKKPLSDLQCPLDNKAQPQNLDEFPENYIVKELIAKRSTKDICEIHKKKINLLCLSDRKKICKNCLNDHEGHKLRDIEFIKDKVAKDSKKIKDYLDSINVFQNGIEKILEDASLKQTKQIQEKFKEMRQLLDEKECELIFSIKAALWTERQNIKNITSEKIRDFSERKSILSNIFNPQESIIAEDYSIDLDIPELPNEKDFNKLQEKAKEEVEKVFSSFNDQLNEQRRLLSTFKLSYSFPVEALTTSLVGKSNKEIVFENSEIELRRFETDSSLKFFYTESNVSIQHGDYQKTFIDLDKIIKAKKVCLALYGELNQEDLKILTYIWKRLKNPETLSLELQTRGMNDETYKILSKGPDTFTKVFLSTFGYTTSRENHRSINLFDVTFLKMKNIKELSFRIPTYQMPKKKKDEYIFLKKIFNPDHLETISMDLFQRKVTDKDMAFIFINMPCLEKMEINLGVTNITNYTLTNCNKTFNSARGLKIVNLNLTETNITDEAIKILSNGLSFLNNLENFSINLSFTKISDTYMPDLIGSLTNLSNIKSLSLILNDTNVSDITLSNLKDFISSAKIENLLLRLGNTKTTGKGIKTFLSSKIQNLKELTLTPSSEVTDESIKPFLEDMIPKMTELKKLSLELWHTKVTQALRNEVQVLQNKVSASK